MTSLGFARKDTKYLGVKDKGAIHLTQVPLHFVVSIDNLPGGTMSRGVAVDRCRYL